MIRKPLSEDTFFSDVLGAMYWLDNAFQINLEAMGFERTTRAETFVILNIADGEQKAIDIAKNIGISRTAISQILKDFGARGWITVQADPNDRRARIVKFSQTFAARGEMCSQIIRGIIRELEDRIGKNLVDALRAALVADWGEPPRLNLSYRPSAPNDLNPISVNRSKLDDQDRRVFASPKAGGS